MTTMVVRAVVLLALVATSVIAEQTSSNNNNVDDVFGMMDKDEDGRVSQAEFFALMHDTDESKQLYESEDKNSDGFISFEEFSGPKGVVAQSDAPATPLPQQEQVQQPQQQEQQQQQPAQLTPEQQQQLLERRKLAFTNFDADGSGAVERAEFFAKVPQSAVAVAAFEAEDDDASGSLSLAEFRVGRILHKLQQVCLFVGRSLDCCWLLVACGFVCWRRLFSSSHGCSVMRCSVGCWDVCAGT